jgi:hypothetical protein
MIPALPVTKALAFAFGRYPKCSAASRTAALVFAEIATSSLPLRTLETVAPEVFAALATSSLLGLRLRPAVLTELYTCTLYTETVSQWEF